MRIVIGRRRPVLRGVLGKGLANVIDNEWPSAAAAVAVRCMAGLGRLAPIFFTGVILQIDGDQLLVDFCCFGDINFISRIVKTFGVGIDRKNQIEIAFRPLGSNSSLIWA